MGCILFVCGVMISFYNLGKINFVKFISYIIIIIFVGIIDNIRLIIIIYFNFIWWLGVGEIVKEVFE